MTQMGHLSNVIHLKKHYCSPNPAVNVHHHQEYVATDYVYADVPAVDDGSMGADKISTSLVECERVKAKIGKALRTDGLPRMWTKFPPVGENALL